MPVAPAGAAGASATGSSFALGGATSGGFELVPSPAAADETTGTATAAAVPAVVVAEPVGVASPTFVPQATATAVPVMGYLQ